MMNRTFSLILAVTIGGPLGFAAEISTFKAYVDSDLCARLMLGPITSARIECSQKTHKDGSEPVLVRLSNNMVLDVNKDKMVSKFVGQLVEATGELKIKDAEVKLKEVGPIQASSIPAGDPTRKLLDVRTYRAPDAPQMYEKIRHELAMMPYISEFDFISFDAQNLVKNIEGVRSVINNIDVLPLGSFDMRIRGAARAVLQQNLSRYFWGSGSDIKIIVKNGDVILLGAVTTSGDKDIAGIRCNSLPGVFHVFNLLRVEGGAQKKGA
jgi:BON domain